MSRATKSWDGILGPTHCTHWQEGKFKWPLWPKCNLWPRAFNSQFPHNTHLLYQSGGWEEVRGAHPGAQTYFRISPREVSPLRPTARPTTCRATPGYAGLCVVLPTLGFIEAHATMLQTSGCTVDTCCAKNIKMYMFCCGLIIPRLPREVHFVLPPAGGRWVFIMPKVKVRFKETRKASFLVGALCLFSTAEKCSKKRCLQRFPSHPNQLIAFEHLSPYIYNSKLEH